ncbi:MAG: hypothetical protein AAF961_08190, partial [Planctomycetota bacterium]
MARKRLGMERLETRQLLAAQPAVDLQAPSQVFLGEHFRVVATFDNVDATDVGYGPFVDLYVPVNGADGLGGVDADGMSLVGDAAYLGSPVVTTILTFPDDGGGTGAVTHPYAVDASGAPLTVSGVAGDQLIVAQLPFGSFTAAQPPAEVTFDLTMSELADLQQPLTMHARAGFQYGNTSLNDPAVDPSLVSDGPADATSWSAAASVEPALLSLSKNYLGPEDETATGPNFPRQYEIVVDVAEGQEISDLDITDVLPANVVLESVDAISTGGATTVFPTTPANPPDNRLVANIPNVIGGPGSRDATLLFTFHVPFRDAAGGEAVDSISGDDAVSPNQAAAVGNWIPTDPRDSGGVDNAAADATGPEHVLSPKSIAVQKSRTLVDDPDGNGFSPGDTVEFTIDFQVSDFFGFDNVVIDDVVSDGHRFDASFAPILSATEHGVLNSAPFDPANYSVVDHFTGGSPATVPI